MEHIKLFADLRPDNPRYEDFPEFLPDFSPAAMLRLGVFSGAYFSKGMLEDIADIDPEIFKAGNFAEEFNPRFNNRFGVHSGQSLEEWQAKGWIHPQDPLGWFHWYCRFHSGRRTEDDRRQIDRWLDFRNRWKPNSIGALMRMNPKAGTRQALLHWAINPYLPEFHVHGEI
jgi:hypothetical protein